MQCRQNFLYNVMHELKHCCWLYPHDNSSEFCFSSSEHMRNQLSARDQRLALTICKLCMGYLICNVPIIIYKGVYGHSNLGNSYVILLVSALFWMQSSVNFVLYAGSNKQYRETIQYTCSVFGCIFQALFWQF